MKTRPRKVRPSDLLCVFCSVAAGGERAIARSPAHARRLERLLARLRREPTMLALDLRCARQSAEKRRDLHALQRMGLVPGDTRPALDLLRRILESVPDVQDLCAPSCPHAARGWYAAARAKGPASVVPGRSAAEMARAKEESVRLMRAADRLRIRPHHLMCMACFHGGRETLAPIAEDNLFEAVDIVQRNPDLPVTLVEGCCMICPPCASYEPRTNRCTGDIGMSLRDELKDLDVLALTGLSYGDTVPARELYRRLFDRIASTRQVCGYRDGVQRSREWRVCGGPDGDARYVRARQAGLGIPGLRAET